MLVCGRLFQPGNDHIHAGNRNAGHILDGLLDVFLHFGADRHNFAAVLGNYMHLHHSNAIA